jgi:rRNA processing protein Gar1
LERIGEILHIIGDKKAIAKVNAALKVGSIVFDVKKKPIGPVTDIFGPVKSPYIEIEVKDSKNIANSPIYILPKTKNVKGKR